MAEPGGQARTLSPYILDRVYRMGPKAFTAPHGMFAHDVKTTSRDEIKPVSVARPSFRFVCASTQCGLGTSNSRTMRDL